MRALGIEAAKDLQQFAEHLIDHGNLVADCSSYSYILRALQPSGSIIKYLAGRICLGCHQRSATTYALRINFSQSLSMEGCKGELVDSTQSVSRVD
jgi:hypothetical protein